MSDDTGFAAEIPPKKLASVVWIVPLLLSVVLVAADSAVRLRSIHQASDARFTPAPALSTDATAPSGYSNNQHRIVVPLRGIDGYHWALQTESMAAAGEWRVRRATYDGPPAGRDVHWSSLMRWWTLGVAWIDAKMNGTTLSASIGSVFPWANTLLFVMLLAGMTLLIARRFGALAGGLFALASVTVYPAYDLHAVGTFDHHGLVATCVLATSLFLVAGGAGWVRADDADRERLKGLQLVWYDWLQDETRARRWFIASGVAGGLGLWISAATQIAALIAIGLAALMGAGLARRNTETAWRIAPRLWSIWGAAGAITSVALYAIEYVPALSGIRLEVNHPLHALAWFAAGDLLTRLYRRSQPDTPRNDTPWLVADAFVIAAVPATALLVPATFSLRPGTPVMALHGAYIQEFKSLIWQISQWTWAQTSAGIGLLALLVAVPAVAAARAVKIPVPVRSMVILASVPAAALTLLALAQIRWLGPASTLWIGALVVLTMFVTLGRSDWDGSTAKHLVAGGAAAAVLAMLPLALSRSGASGAGALIGTVTIAAGVWASIEVARGVVSKWTPSRLKCAGVFVGLALLPHPVSALYNWIAYGVNFHATQDDVAQLVTRDVAQKIRARIGGEAATILSGPTTSTWLTWFGGTRSLATLYWENAEGIAAAAHIFNAAPDSARQIAEASGVTHIVIFSWDQMAIDFAELTTPSANSERSLGKDILAGQLPSWVRPIPYELPRLPYFQDPWVLILEFAPQQPREEGLVRQAQFHLANNRMAEGTAMLTSALAARGDYLPALIQLANAQFGAPGANEFDATMHRVRAALRDTSSIAFEDDAFLAIAFDLAGDSAQTRSALGRALRRADEGSVRRFGPDQATLRFLQLAHVYGVAATNTRAIELAKANLRPDLHAHIERR